MVGITDRHQLILQRLQDQGRVEIQELSEFLQVSSVTIRKDLKLLEERKLLFRTKGGGSVDNPYTIERPINEKEFINAEEKKKIARAALQLITQTDSIIIGSGTTVYELAKELYPAKHLIVITPALKVALELYNRPSVEVLQLPGLIHPTSASAGGSFSELILDHISADILFLGADGIDPGFGISITNLNEAGLIRKLIQVAQKVVVLADSSKFGRRGLGRICGLDLIQFIITDNRIAPESVNLLEEKGIKMIIAE